MIYDTKASGLRIQHLRKNMGLSMEELSDRLSVSDRQLRRIEKGESGGSVDLLIEISLVFNVSLDYLILGKVATNSDAKKLIKSAIDLLVGFEREIISE